MWGVGRAGRMVGRSFVRGARGANLNSKVCQPLLKMQISALPRFVHMQYLQIAVANLVEIL